MNNTPDQHTQADKQKDTSYDKFYAIKVIIDALANNIDSKWDEHKKNKWPKRMALAAIAYTFFTFFIMLVTAYQVSLIRSNNIVSQRAFISFNHQPAVANGDPANPAQIIFGGDLVNSGNTPTKNLTSFINCAKSDTELQEPWTIRLQGGPDQKPIPQFIGPHASVPVACGIPFDEIEQAANGKLFEYVIIDVSYRDRLDDSVPHKTEITLFLSQVHIQQQENFGIQPGGHPVISNGPVQIQTLLVARGNHNCADEECPPDDK